MAYLSSDPRATLRAVALQCLSRLALQASRSNAFVGDEFHVILSVIEDVAAPPALHVLTFQLLKKVSFRSESKTPITFQLILACPCGVLRQLVNRFLQLCTHDFNYTLVFGEVSFIQLMLQFH